MKIVVQRVKSAAVTNTSIHHEISQGLCLLVGVGQGDTIADVEALAKKIANARIFEDEAGKLNLNVQQIEGEVLSISQFTLYADVKKGNRPGFSNAMAPDEANALYEKFNDALRNFNLTVKTGDFGTDMLIDIQNDGPVTIIYETENGKIV
ncbi:D-tyrosyl-tRNA(Tyr) deacylase [Staphylococcus muscae]|uniref:D-aminoacyl-tRNA deacylase n=1 Tax=Staphylococcus muscae TaxID=1294 RepID=A0A240C305_9STAP|nr:D-aminoacyl-tRNA deacylase [Staphylococcus muscae]AVQ32988.1 D-tyrosyl-tRNA(Tyr) deacylase [Staphylococcus muscae]PNZ04644.1 D-tyrosyl-tRNA(Tyr) deacylase [Staphylococcus muscae]GGA89241.1 D-aminoacyl-tRNA deacylase [Staphylococcus muscae]SNW02285.1 D-tyrosyl-tRNA(Tyr) deacylase [Staphylococcus muscae]